MKPLIVDKKATSCTMLLVFCSFHITHNIQKPISSLLQDGANYSAQGFFFRQKKVVYSTAAVLALACKQKYDGSISYPEPACAAQARPSKVRCDNRDEGNRSKNP